MCIFYSRTLLEGIIALSLSGSAGTAIASSLLSVMQGLAGRPGTAYTIPAVSTSGSAVSVMAGLSTGCQSSPGVKFPGVCLNEYVDGALKVIQQAIRKGYARISGVSSREV